MSSLKMIKGFVTQSTQFNLPVIKTYEFFVRKYLGCSTQFSVNWPEKFHTLEQPRFNPFLIRPA